jgi:hypothetical protein
MKIRRNFAIRQPHDVPVELFGHLQRFNRFMYLGNDDQTFRPVSHTELKLILRNMVRVGMLEVTKSPSRFIERGTCFRLTKAWKKAIYIDREHDRQHVLNLQNHG